MKAAITPRRWPLALALSLTFLVAAQAGQNEGFTASIGGPTRVKNPQIGDQIQIRVEAEGTTAVKGFQVAVVFDPDLVSYVSFAAGNLNPAALTLPGAPAPRADGLSAVKGGGTSLGGSANAISSGTVGTYTFEVIAEIPETGTFISVTEVEVNTSSTDTDILTHDLEEFGVNLVLVFGNKIRALEIQRKHNGAVFTWNTQFPGFNDIVRVRLADSTDEFTTFESPLKGRFSAQEFQALGELLDAGLDLQTVTDKQISDVLKDALGLPLVPASLIREVRKLGAALQSNSHVVIAAGLAPATMYECLIKSVALNGAISQTVRQSVKTRTAPDLRVLFASSFDIQTTPTAAAVSFGTNRPTITDYVLTAVEAGTEIAAETVNQDGETRTRIVFDNLLPGTEYEIALVLTLLGAAELIDSGMPEAATTKTIVHTFKTRLRGRPLRVLGRPARIVGTDQARIGFALNQPAGAILDYGIITWPSEKITAESSATDAELYEWQTQSTADLAIHNIELINLDPSTTYRYKITLVNAEGDTFTTDPRGNEQWSHDLRFTTSAAADTMPPVLIEGPIGHIVDVLAVLGFRSDVPTAATVFIGTADGTYRTEDEFEFPDLTADGERVFRNWHSIILSGLEPDAMYEYRILMEAANGRTTVFEPSTVAGAAKIAGILQPRGGAGSFTTSNDPDTQYPVILSGPTVTSKTHATAIIEWTTDEPADGDISFGVEELTDSETSGVSETGHKMTLSNLDAGATYSYKVASTDAIGNGATESGEAVFTTNPELDLTAPAILEDPEVIYKNEQTATIQWMTDEDASAEVEFGLDASLGFIRSLPTTDKLHTITLTNLEPSTTYLYRVSSIDLSNNGPTQSSLDSFMTDAEADTSAPQVDSVRVAAADSSAIITWVTDEMADSFVDFGTVEGVLDLVVGDVDDVIDHEITLTNLEPGTTYYFTVGSIDRASNGPSRSVVDTFTTAIGGDVTPPATPTGLAAIIGSRQVVLSWTANTELDLAGYSVYRQASFDTATVLVASPVTETTYRDLGLIDEVPYVYQIAAIDRSDNIAPLTDALSVTPTASAAPSIPTGLARSGDDFLRPTFLFSNATPFNAGASLSYTIQVSTQPDFSNVADSESGILEGSGDAGTGLTAWTITRDLTEGTTYYWRARAMEGDLIGPFSDTQEFVARAVAALTGDFNGDDVVGFDDFFMFVDVFGGPATGDDAIFDLNSDGNIGFTDFFIFVDAFGSTAAAKSRTFAHRMDETAVLSLAATGGSRDDDGLVTLRVWAEGVEDLGAFGLVLAYDPRAVTFGSAEEGPGHLLESQGATSGLFAVLSHRPGEILLANGLTQGDPVAGKGLLAELTFQSNGRSTLNQAFFDLREAYLAGGDGQVRRVSQIRAVQLRPTAYALGANFPNPFNPSTTIEYALPEQARVELAVYDVLGRRIRVLAQNDDHPSGFHAVGWDGRDAAGRSVGNGVYFYRLSTPAFQQTGKMLLVK